MSQLQPSQVTNNANGKLLQIIRVAESRHLPSVQRMAEIVALTEAYRAEVGMSPYAKL